MSTESAQVPKHNTFLQIDAHADTPIQHLSTAVSTRTHVGSAHLQKCVVHLHIRVGDAFSCT